MWIPKGYISSRLSVRLSSAKTTILGSTLFVLVVYLLAQRSKFPTTAGHLVPKYNQPVCDSLGDHRTSLTDILRNHSPGPREICRCNGTHMFDKGASTGDYAESTCSIEATRLGPNQSVVSFSLFQAPKEAESEFSLSDLLEGVEKNLSLLREIYPGWLMRIYTDVTFNPQVCAVVCSSDDIFFCDIKHLPGIEEATMTSILPMAWRFLPLGDPSVGKFLVRDLDSLINQREKSAVKEWLESGYPFHGMRDHPRHGYPIMGGMWGADNDKVCWSTAKDLQRRILMTNKRDDAMPDDMALLELVIYESQKDKFLTHDSYFCETFADSVPFPTQRLPLMNYIGSSFSKPVPSLPCPYACRPSYGKDWIMC